MNILWPKLYILLDRLHHYFDLFYTTRNGLFFGLIYVTLGALVGKYQDKIQFEFKWHALVTAFAYVVLEGYVLYPIDRALTTILFCRSCPFPLFSSPSWSKPSPRTTYSQCPVLLVQHFQRPDLLCPRLCGHVHRSVWLRTYGPWGLECGSDNLFD